MAYELTHLDLFSGIGGFALAANWAGFRTVGFSEIDPYCCRLLEQNFPGVPNFGDIRSADLSSIGAIDLLSGGYPCQPFSQAGNRRGAADDRHLWPSMRDAIEKIRPAWIVAENVAGHVSLGLDEVLTDLENLHYTSQSIIIPACAVGTWHRRDRVWIVGHADSEQWKWSQGKTGMGLDGEELVKDKREQMPDSANGTSENVSHSKSDNERVLCKREQAKESRSSSRGEDVPHAKCARLERFTGDGNRGNQSRRISEKKNRSVSEDGLSRYNADIWVAEPSVGRVAHGIPRRVDRLKGLGNAIVPQVAYQILRAIAEIERA